MKSTMRTIAVAATIAAPTSAVWEIIRSGTDLNRWVPAVTACRVDGSGVGARRVCTIGGSELQESIETVDDTNQLFQYRILEQSMMPVVDVLGTIHVSSVAPAGTHVLWFVNLTLTHDAAWEAVRTAIEGIYSAGIAGLESLANQASV